MAAAAAVVGAAVLVDDEIADLARRNQSSGRSARWWVAPMGRGGGVGEVVTPLSSRA